MIINLWQSICLSIVSRVQRHSSISNHFQSIRYGFYFSFVYFSITGGCIQPKRDLTRYLRWPKYVRLQRQKAVLLKRLKVPATINQFNTAVDRQTGVIFFHDYFFLRVDWTTLEFERIFKWWHFTSPVLLLNIRVKKLVYDNSDSIRSNLNSNVFWMGGGVWFMQRWKIKILLTW